MRVAAVADVHSPRFLSEFRHALTRCVTPDIFLLAGDMIEAGRLYEYQNIIKIIINHFGEEVPVIACFGNDENVENKEEIREVVKERICFLDGEITIISAKEIKIGILGVPLLDAANSLQDMTLESIVEKRINELSKRLEELKKRCHRTILLMHYSPISTETYPVSFTWWISRVFANVVPDIIIHGHIHYATNPETQIEDTRVVNVAYPATRKITEIVLEK